MTKTALVSGANQGIGLELCRQLGDLGFSVILTARNDGAGRAAAEAVGAEYRHLDVTRAEDIAALADGLRSETRSLDLLINNAAIELEGFNQRIVEETVAVNFFGALNLTEALLPLIADGGTIVMVASAKGELAPYAPPIRARFADPALTRDQLVALIDEFIASVHAGRHLEAGWSSSPYGVSKAGMIALAKILARDLAPRRIRVVSTSPGWVRTRMGGGNATRSIEDGAGSIVWAATNSAATSGSFSREGRLAVW